jgi:hypothetical protein
MTEQQQHDKEVGDEAFTEVDVLVQGGVADPRACSLTLEPYSLNQKPYSLNLKP